MLRCGKRQRSSHLSSEAVAAPPPPGVLLLAPSLARLPEPGTASAVCTVALAAGSWPASEAFTRQQASRSAGSWAAAMCLGQVQ